MQTFQIKYQAKFTDGDKNGVYLVRAEYASKALQLFDWEMAEKPGLMWILHREFIHA